MNYCGDCKIPISKDAKYCRKHFQSGERSSFYGKKHVWTDEMKEKLRQKRLGEKNPLWRGDKVGYNALHAWVRRRLLRPKVCSLCKVGFPIDLANISQKYKRDLSDWEWLCRKCHMIKDGRMNGLHSKEMQIKIAASIPRGKNHPMWKGGLPKCPVCQDVLGDRRSLFCLKHKHYTKED